MMTNSMPSTVIVLRFLNGDVELRRVAEHLLAARMTLLAHDGVERPFVLSRRTSGGVHIYREAIS